jgi:hypothetical protein
MFNFLCIRSPMKIKLVYPKIPNTLHCPLRQCIAFEKIDGTNIHWVWCPQNGFHSFGTRRDRYTYNDVGLAEFHQYHFGLDGLEKAFQKIEGSLSEFLLKQFPDSTEIIVFTEIVGPSSFAGKHKQSEEKQAIIFDVQIDGSLLPPDQFINMFQGFTIPKVVFQGKFSGQLFMDVRNGKYPLKEGVVVKGIVDGQVYMAKIKTHAYAQKLMEKFKLDWKEYWE